MFSVLDHTDLRSVAAHLGLGVQDVNTLINAEVYALVMILYVIALLKGNNYDIV